MACRVTGHPMSLRKDLFGRPTLVNNIETLWWVRDIVEKGGTWFAEQGREGHPDSRSYSVSGRVKKPGVKVPAGVTVQELIDEHCGGMLDGHHFKGYLLMVPPAAFFRLPWPICRSTSDSLRNTAVLSAAMRSSSSPTRTTCGM